MKKITIHRNHPVALRLGFALLVGMFMGGAIAYTVFYLQGGFEERAWIAENQAVIATITSQKNTKQRQRHSRQRMLFPFNPNTLNAEGWLKMGFSEKQTKMILNYRQKANRFTVKTDLKKLHCIDNDTYAELEPYIMLPDQKPAAEHFSPVPQKLKPTSPSIFIALNACDSVELMQLKGIGSVFSKRIVEYRERLGGYHHIDQLLEVKGMTEETVQRIKEQLGIDTTAIRKIAINTVSLSDLRKHPYLNYYQAKSIISYRDKHRPIRSLNEIRALPLIDTATYRKIAPYINVDHQP